jgi:hypothetical protein
VPISATTLQFLQPYEGGCFETEIELSRNEVLDQVEQLPLDWPNSKSIKIKSSD